MKWAPTARTVAAILGGLYFVLGIIGFVPAFWERPAGRPPLTISVFYVSLLGVLLTNIILSMVHLVIGLWGMMAANNKYSSVVFCRTGPAIFLILGIAGAIPIAVVNTVWGTVPLGGNNVILHIASAVIAVFFGIKPGYELTTIGVAHEMNPHAPEK